MISDIKPLHIKLLFTVSLIASVLYVVLGTQSSSALSLSPSPSIPSHVRTTLERCDNPGYNPYRQSPGFASWISPRGNPSTTQVSVSEGASSVDLTYHAGAVVCYDYGSNGVRRSNTRVTSLRVSIVDVHTGSTVRSINIGGLPDRMIDWEDSYTTVGSYRGVSSDFSVQVTGLTPGTYNIRVTATGKAINHFGSGAYICVGNRDEGTEYVVGGFNDAAFNRCVDTDTLASIALSVRPPAFNNIIVNASCTRVRVRVGGVQGGQYENSFNARLFVNGHREVVWGGTPVAFQNHNVAHQNGGIVQIPYGTASGMGAVFDVSPFRSFSPQTFSVRIRARTAAGGVDGTVMSPLVKPSAEPSGHDIGGGNLACAKIDQQNISCDELTATVLLVGGGGYASRLIVDGEEVDSGYLQPPGYANSTSGNSISHDIREYKDVFSRNIQARLRPSGSAYASRNTILDYFGPESPLYQNYSAEYGTARTSASGVGPCVDIFCGGVATNPATIEPNQEFEITLDFRLSEDLGPKAKPLRYRVIYHNSEFPFRLIPDDDKGIVYDGNTISVTDKISSSNPAVWSMRYRLQYTDRGSFSEGGVRTFPLNPSEDPCGGEVEIGNKPYHKVYGGDVLAGMARTGANGSCSTNDEAIVKGWNNGIKEGYSGAGSQLAVFALGQINYFASAQFKKVPKGLSFANTDNDEYGGLLSPEALDCGPNFWTGAPVNNQPVPAPINPGTDGVYKTSSDTTIEVNSGGIGAGRVVTIYVEGDAYIPNNIAYQPGNYSSLDQIPQFRLIVKGDIYVSPTVTELNGLFVAMKKSDGGGGRFYTCGSGIGGGRPPSLIMVQAGGPCSNNKLTVYGAVVADQIKFSRSLGTVGDAETDERYNTGGNPAEVFVYTPEVWLRGGGYAGEGDAAAFMTLPPVL